MWQSRRELKAMSLKWEITLKREGRCQDSTICFATFTSKSHTHEGLLAKKKYLCFSLYYGRVNIIQFPSKHPPGIITQHNISIHKLSYDIIFYGIISKKTFIDCAIQQNGSNIIFAVKMCLAINVLPSKHPVNDSLMCTQVNKTKRK